MKLFIITREENQYDQFGEYFVAAFTVMPTIEQLNKLGIDSICGRLEDEETWYNLRVIEEGEQLEVEDY